MSEKKLSSLDSGFEAFKKNLHSNSKLLLKTKIPNKIVNINKLFESKTFDASTFLGKLNDFNESQMLEFDKYPKIKARDKDSKHRVSSSEESSSIEAPEPIVRLVNVPELKSNEVLMKLFTVIKPIMIESLEDVKTLLLWIQLKVPEIADGNNFGVSVQEEVLSCLRSIESQIVNDLDIFTDYFNQRGKIFVKLIKFSEILDFRRDIIEHDEAFYFKLRETMKDLKHHYMIMHNLCLKNIAKITVPRNEKNNVISSMY